MSCQNVVDAAQAVIDGLDHDIPVSLAALAKTLKAYREEKRFVSGLQVLKEYIPDREKLFNVHPWL